MGPSWCFTVDCNVKHQEGLMSYSYLVMDIQICAESNMTAYVSEYISMPNVTSIFRLLPLNALSQSFNSKNNRKQPRKKNPVR